MLIKKVELKLIINLSNTSSAQLKSSGLWIICMSSLFSSDKINQTKVNNILEIMEDIDTFKFCQSMAESHWYKAKEIISTLDLNDKSKKDLEELGEFLLYRES